MSKHNYLVQSDKKDRSYSILQLVYLRVNKPSITFEVMYLCESC